MAIIDAIWLLSDDQDLTGTSAVLSENVVDLGSVGGNDLLLGDGNPVYLTVVCTTDATGTSPTLIVKLNTDTDATVTDGVALLTSDTIDIDGAVKGDVLYKVALPKSKTGYSRYLGAVYTQGGTTPTIGVSAYIGPEDLS